MYDRDTRARAKLAPEATSHLALFRLTRPFRVLRAMADVLTAPPDRKKVVLIGFGGKTEQQTNARLFDWANVNIVDEEDDVYVVHFTRTKKHGMSAIRTASTQRAGVTVVDVAALNPEPTGEDDSVRPKVPPEWLPSAVIDSMNKRRSACHSCIAAVFEVDLDSGFGTAEVRRPAVVGRTTRRGRSETASWFSPSTDPREKGKRTRTNTNERERTRSRSPLRLFRFDRSASPPCPTASTHRTPPACTKPWWSRLRTSSASARGTKSS